MLAFLVLVALAACLALGAALWLEHRELERAKGAIRRLWSDRDELRKEVNGLRRHVGEKLAAAGLAPAVVHQKVREPCSRCGTFEGERVGGVCLDCHGELGRPVIS